MVCLAAFFHINEFIFPEMAALTVGCWIVNKQVWAYKRWHLIVITSIAALSGTLIVYFSKLDIASNMLLGFIFAVILLTVSRTSIRPIISAALLPILMNSDSFLYPTFVFILTLLLVLVQKLLEKNHIRTENKFIPFPIERVTRFIHWLILAVFLSPLLYSASYFEYKYCLLPPLIVTYVEFCNANSGFIQRPVSTVLLMTISSIIGCILAYLSYGQSYIIIGLAAGCTLLLIFLIFHFYKKSFAPATAISLVPFIIPFGQLSYIPFYVFIGSIYLIFVSVYVVRPILSKTDIQINKRKIKQTSH